MDSLWRYFRLIFTKNLSYFQGARWDLNAGSIAESKLKELHPAMPIMFIKAVTQETSVSVLQNMTTSRNMCRTSRTCETSMIAQCTRLANEDLPTFGLLVSRQRASHPSGFLRVLVFFYKYKRSIAYKYKSIVSTARCSRRSNGLGYIPSRPSVRR